MKRTWLLLPVAAGVLPVLSMLGANADSIPLRMALRPCLLMAALSLSLVLAIRLWLHDGIRAACLASLTVLLFSTYGSVYAHVGALLGHGLLLSAWSATWMAAAWLLWKRASWAVPMRDFLTAVVAVALVLTLVPLVGVEARLAQPPADLGALEGAPPTRASSLSPPAPDIYYIILDGYAGQPVLQDIYHYDNAAFLDVLRREGFYVAEHSRSNYGQTSLSLASSLNMTYLDFLRDEEGEASRDQVPLARMIRWNAVQRALAELGYRTIAFSTGYRRTEVDTADHFLISPSRNVTPFESALLETTALTAVAEVAGAQGMGFPYPGYSWQRDQIRFTFSQLAEVSAWPGPKFVFAHIIAPHPPFVFRASGEPASPPYPYRLRDGDEFPGTVEEYIAGYTSQLTYVNSQVIDVLRAILTNSPNEPVIILQADHGPGSRTNWAYPEATDLNERLSILNAYHLPGGEPPPLYDTISPVNTFRIVFNRYFGTDYEILPDRSYFSSWTAPYDFIAAP